MKVKGVERKGLLKYFGIRSRATDHIEQRLVAPSSVVPGKEVTEKWQQQKRRAPKDVTGCIKLLKDTYLVFI